MIDAFDMMAFAVFAILLIVAVIIVVSLGQLPGRIAQKRRHPQAAAINAAGWLGVATLGLLWPLALIWAFLKPVSIETHPFLNSLPHETGEVFGQFAERAESVVDRSLKCADNWR